MTDAACAFAAMRALPLADLVDIIGGTSPMVLAPHPDDEVIGCGALLAEAAAQGGTPSIVFITDGAGSHPNSAKYAPPLLAELREAEAITAAGILGVSPARLHFLRLHDTAAPHDGPPFAAAVAMLVGLIERFRPNAILAPWSADPHCDHLATHKMARAASARAGVRHLSYPIWGWTLPPDADLGDRPIAGFRLACHTQSEVKRRALNAHRSQLGHLIDDDPQGFRLDDATLAKMLSESEVFMTNP